LRQFGVDMKKELMTYKESIATIHFANEDDVFYGKIEGIPDLVSFEGRSVDELKEAFKEAVEDYLESCQNSGKYPEKSFKGSFNIRVTPELHKRAYEAAKWRKISLNKLVQQALEKDIME
jgi:predicted HicB family RNase H-like nuclease